MKTIFERLKKISAEYRDTVDDLGENYELDGRRDYLFSDAVQAEKVAERNSKFNSLVDEAAEKARTEAESEISKLREKLKGYITSSDNVDMLTTVQALIAGNVTLTDVELAAFSGKGGFAARKLLEKYTNGRIAAPKLDALERDVRELETFFKDIGCYRSTMAQISTASPWGLAPSVGSTIMKGKIDHFADKLAEIETRWAILERGSAA